MKIPTSHFKVTEHPGETGHAFSRKITIGDIRIRMVEYTPAISPIIGVIVPRSAVFEGVLDTELRDGRSARLA